MASCPILALKSQTTYILRHCVCVSVSVCLSIYLYVCICVFMYVCMYVCLPLGLVRKAKAVSSCLTWTVWVWFPPFPQRRLPGRHTSFQVWLAAPHRVCCCSYLRFQIYDELVVMSMYLLTSSYCIGSQRRSQQLAARAFEECSVCHIKSTWCMWCEAVRPSHLVRPKIRLAESGTDLITILRCFLSFKTVFSTSQNIIVFKINFSLPENSHPSRCTLFSTSCLQAPAG